jgi:hypothetical protein
VAEMVSEYLKAEKEMEHILRDNRFINSGRFYSDNIMTAHILAGATVDERDYFMECIEKTKQAAENCVERLQSSTNNAKRHFLFS